MTRKKTDVVKVARGDFAAWMEDLRIHEQLEADLTVLFEVARALLMRAAASSDSLREQILGVAEGVSRDIREAYDRAESERKATAKRRRDRERRRAERVKR